MQISPSIRRRLLPISTLCVALSLGLAAGAFAQEPLRVETDPMACLPIGENAAAWATVENNVPDAEVRLYFRRLHDAVEDLYWVRMHPDGEGRYWGVFPKAEDRVLQRHELIETRREVQEQTSWAQWWREKDVSDDRNPNQDLDPDLIRERASQGKQIERDWLGAMSDDEFQRWLEQLENEPAEYFAAVHDFRGQRLAKSVTRVVEVQDDCRLEMTAAQLGEAENLTVGETAYWQRGEELFHWLCDGIVSRVDPSGVKRGDSICRACVVAWWRQPGILVPAASSLAAVTGVVIIEDSDPDDVSPSAP